MNVFVFDLMEPFCKYAFCPSRGNSKHLSNGSSNQGTSSNGERAPTGCHGTITERPPCIELFLFHICHIFVKLDILEDITCVTIDPNVLRRAILSPDERSL